MRIRVWEKKLIPFGRTGGGLVCLCVASVHARVMSKWWLHKKLNLRRRRRRGPFISPGERVLSPPPPPLPPPFATRIKRRTNRRRSAKDEKKCRKKIRNYSGRRSALIILQRCRRSLENNIIIFHGARYTLFGCAERFLQFFPTRTIKDSYLYPLPPMPTMHQYKPNDAGGDDR